VTLLYQGAEGLGGRQKVGEEYAGGVVAGAWHELGRTKEKQVAHMGLRGSSRGSNA
jgi:hypothetical protein